MRADVLYSPFGFVNFGTALSIECIGSYELAFTKNNTINFWGGFGAVSRIRFFRYPSFGTELAIEVRQYFKNSTFKNFNIGIYSGLAFMRNSSFYDGHFSRIDNSVGFVPGIKLTYKKSFNSWLIGEPYISFSTPWDKNSIGELFKDISKDNLQYILTIGLRIGFNWVGLKK